MIGLFRAGGFSLDLTHHAMHAMGSRMFGFTQELFNDTTDVDPAAEAEMWGAMAGIYPYIYELFTTISHDDAIGRRRGLRRPVRVRVRTGPDARRHREDEGSISGPSPAPGGEATDDRPVGDVGERLTSGVAVRS